jgi:hypothetical protein
MMDLYIEGAEAAKRQLEEIATHTIGALSPIA